MNSTERALLKSLVHVIWADGEVDDNELRLLGGVLTQLGASAASIEEVAQMMTKPPDLKGLKDMVPDPEARREILKVVLAMALADGKVDLKELRFLNKLAMQLEIADEDLETLKRETLEAVEGGS